MGWIVSGSVKVCKGEKITKSLQYTIYFLQSQSGFTAFQFMKCRPVLDSQRHLRTVRACYPCSNQLALHKEKGQACCTFSKGAIMASLLQINWKLSFCSSHNGLQIFQIVVISPLLLKTLKILIFEFWPSQGCSCWFWSRLKLCTYYVLLLENGAPQLWLHPTELKTTSLSVPRGW